MTEHLTPGDQPPASDAPGASPIFRILVVVAILLVAGGALRLLLRHRQFQALAEETAAMTVPTVAVIHPVAQASTEQLVLPGTLQAYVQAPIYARTSGYLRRWYHDIGDRVEKGDPLADIETPEVDQQLQSARADLLTAQANARLAQVTETRYHDLLKSDSVSRQEVDNAEGDLAAKRATVRSMEANVRRLEDTRNFQRVFSPFSGVVTRRNVDTGTLVNAGNGGATQTLFVLAQTDPLRVYVNVPEAAVPSIHRGLTATLTVPQLPGETFEGRIVRTAETIDPATRALLTEIDVPNGSGELLPGGYAQVRLDLKVGGERMLVPVNALLFRAEGLRAAVVEPDHRVRLQPLTVGRDYGTSLEVLSGLAAGDLLVLNPPDSLEAGQEVRLQEVSNPIRPRTASLEGDRTPGVARATAEQEPRP